jgi:hypothetical protein
MPVKEIQASIHLKPSLSAVLTNASGHDKNEGKNDAKSDDKKEAPKEQ